MEFNSKIFQASLLGFLFFSLLVMPKRTYSQGTLDAESGRDSLIVAAREIMKAAHYCALITVNSSGQPQARVMDAFLPEDDMVVWLATNSRSRKVKQIERDSRVTLFYFDKEGLGYVSLMGQAQLVNNPEEKARRWKEKWKRFYPNREIDYLLISVTPEKLEIVSMKHNIVGENKTWATPTVVFDSSNPEK